MLIQTREQFELALTVLIQADLIAIDIETNWDTFPKSDSWDSEWDDKLLMGISTHCEIKGRDMEMSYYFPFRHLDFDTSLFKVNNENLPYSWLRELAVAFEKPDCEYIFHNFKGDDHVLRKEGIEVSGDIIWDTMIMSWMEDENKFSHRLADLGRNIGEKKLGKELKDIAKALKGWNKLPPEVMALYACEDARITYKLFPKFKLSLESQQLLGLYPREELKTRILQKIESRGVGVHKDVATQLSEEAVANMQEAQAQFGYDPQKPSQLAHRLFSEPPEGLGLQPIGGYSKRKSVEFPPGIPNMDKNILSRLGHEECLRVLEYRRWLKANTTWYSGWFYKTARDDRIHPTFKQHGTKTTRLSCERPNMQQIPRDIEKYPVKKMLKAKEGYELWEFDYSQIEFRLGAVYAECKPILEAYKGNLDVHKLTSERIGIQELSGMSAEDSRYAGKQTNFLTIYGGGVDVLIFQIWRDTKIALDYDVAEEILKRFHSELPEFKRCGYKCESVAKANKYVKLWTGRKRHFDVPWECYKAFNSICQGGAAEIIYESMIMLDEMEIEMVSQVHDSLWVEIPTDVVEQQKEKIIETMSWPGGKFGIPFPVDAKRLA